MKKTTFFCAIALFAAGALFAQTTGKITVAPPAAQNLDDGDKWIPLFVQGQMTADIQNYSDYTVIDRSAAEQLMGEQRVLETASAITDDSVNIQYASIVAADYTVVINLLKKGGGFALDAKILDVKTSQPLGKAYSNANVSAASIDDGSVIHQAAYTLLSGVGINEKRLAALRQNTVRTADVAAQTAVAKGIVAEQSGSNIEALTYYVTAKRNNKNLSEATSRLNNMSAAVASGNFGANAKNLIKMREEWDKLLLEAAELIASNPPEFRMMYFSDIEPGALTEENYKNKTMSFTVSSPYLKQTTNGGDNEQLAFTLLEALDKIPQSANWGDKINGFPWSYADDIKGDNWLKKANASGEITTLPKAHESVQRRSYERRKESETSIWKYLLDEPYFIRNEKARDTFTFVLSLLDANKKAIAKKEVSFSVHYCHRYNAFHVETSNAKAGYPFLELTFENVPVSNADTDKLYISVEQTAGTKTSILPVPEGVLSWKQVGKINERNELPRQIRIGGYIESYEAYGRKNAPDQRGLLSDPGKNFSLVDLSESVITEIQYGGFMKSLVKVILPDSIIKSDGFSGHGGSSFPEHSAWSGWIAFCGTKTQWDTIFSIQPLAVNCNPEQIIKRSLASTTVPAGTVVITKDDFAGCESLETLTIPASVVEVQADAFVDCGKLKTVQYAGTKAQWKAVKIEKQGNKKLLKAKVKYEYKAQ